MKITLALEVESTVKEGETFPKDVVAFIDPNEVLMIVEDAQDDSKSILQTKFGNSYRLAMSAVTANQVWTKARRDRAKD